MGRAAPEVWSALLEHRDRAVRVARARAGGPDDAEEIVQEAMARIAAMPDIDLDRLPGLLAAVTGNLAADAHRLRARDARARGRIARAEACGLAGPEDDICDAHEARWLREVAKTLGGQDRAALQLRADGRSVSQIADELGVTYKAAENALGRARAKMRAAWSATAALLGVLLGRRPRKDPALVVAAPAAALVAVLAVLAGPVQTDAEAGPPAAPAPASAPAPAPPPAPAPVPAAPPPPAPQPAADEQPNPARPAGPAAAPRETPPPADLPVVERSIEAGPVAVHRVHVEEHRQDEAVLDSVQRCAEEGVSLELSRLGCAP